MTIEALLALPAPESIKTVKAPEPPDRRPIAKEPAVPSPTKKPIAAESPGIALELGLEMVGRAGGSQGYLGFGPVLHAAVRIGAWAVGIQGRWDAYERVTTGKYPAFIDAGLPALPSWGFGLGTGVEWSGQ